MIREMHVPMQFYAYLPILIRKILFFQGDKSNNIYALFCNLFYAKLFKQADAISINLKQRVDTVKSLIVAALN